MTSPQFILASSSPRRRELLSTLDIPFTIVKPDIDETQFPNEPPLEYVRRLSREKALEVARIVQNTTFSLQGEKWESDRDQVILAADTVVILGADTLGVDEQGEILGKPADTHMARDMLRRLRGRTHQVCTGLTLVVTKSLISTTEVEAHSLFPKIITHVTCTDVTMREYSDAEIEAYIATGDPFDKAGSYAIQHPTFQPVAHIEGCYTNVVGLPVCTLKSMLAEIGWPGIEAAQGCDCTPVFSGL